jgi:hypothetical protein
LLGKKPMFVCHIKSVSIGIIHLSSLPLCSLRSLWLNHADAIGNDITIMSGTYCRVRQHLNPKVFVVL